MSDLFPRSSGILMHPTSLPGPYGIGDLGDHSYKFIDKLIEHGQTIWQMLPLGPTSYGDSPYQTLSAFAGNPNLISLDTLHEEGFLEKADLDAVPNFPKDRVDYGNVIPWHNDMLHKAYEGFQKNGTAAQKQSFATFVEEQADWLEDFALFNALKRDFDLVAWTEWPDKALVRYEEAALAKAREEHEREIDEQRFRQWCFYTQWMALKAYAGEKGVRLFGDIPIFVAADSADVWSNQKYFFLDKNGNPTVIAGVPPDYFSATGQRWGNPLYRWDVMKEDNYQWWFHRFNATLNLVDYMRVDHFRGFEAYWEIPAEEETAINGEWKPGPSEDFFHALKEELGDLPIIAEDLGVITEGVEKLRDGFNLPGMKVLQFAWSEPTNIFLPHNHEMNRIVYTGTHDNNTTIGWWNNEADDGTRNFIQTYLEREIHEINWRLIQIAMMSPAHTAIFPLQDIFGLGEDARMNKPGVEQGNWTWRFTEDGFEHDGWKRLEHYTGIYQRRPDQQEKVYGDAALKSEVKTAEKSD